MTHYEFSIRVRYHSLITSIAIKCTSLSQVSLSAFLHGALWENGEGRESQKVTNATQDS